jgi:hypothetical protein
MHDAKKTGCPYPYLIGGRSESLILTFESAARFPGAHACHLALEPRLTPLLTLTHGERATGTGNNGNGVLSLERKEYKAQVAY